MLLRICFAEKTQCLGQWSCPLVERDGKPSGGFRTATQGWRWAVFCWAGSEGWGGFLGVFAPWRGNAQCVGRKMSHAKAQRRQEGTRQVGWGSGMMPGRYRSGEAPTGKCRRGFRRAWAKDDDPWWNRRGNTGIGVGRGRQSALALGWPIGNRPQVDNLPHMRRPVVDRPGGLSYRAPRTSFRREHQNTAGGLVGVDCGQEVERRGRRRGGSSCFSDESWAICFAENGRAAEVPGHARCGWRCSGSGTRASRADQGVRPTGAAAFPIWKRVGGGFRARCEL